MTVLLSRKLEFYRIPCTTIADANVDSTFFFWEGCIYKYEKLQIANPFCNIPHIKFHDDRT